MSDKFPLSDTNLLPSGMTDAPPQNPDPHPPQLSEFSPAANGRPQERTGTSPLVLDPSAEDETDPAPVRPALPTALDNLAEAAREYAANRDSANTARAYASDWRQFERWCRRQGFDAKDPDPQMIGLYLAAAAAGKGVRQAAVSTLERRLAALTSTYRSAGTPLDRNDRHIVDVMAGIRRGHAKPPRQKEALFADDILAMLALLPHDLRGLRDRAILLLGFAGGLRRSEIVRLDVGPGQTEDGASWIEILPDGVLLTIRGKTGWRTVEIAPGSADRTCPVAALKLWLQIGRIAHGPVFRRILKANTGVTADRLSDKHIARLVKRLALAAGARGDLSEGDRALAFSGHSLRAGLASSAEVDEAEIQRQLGHASAEMTRRYVRRRGRFRVNLTKAAGL